MSSDALEALAATPRLLIALDFDGTLSPLVDEPMSARMVPEARAALEALAALPDTTVALVSGRSLADLAVIAEHDAASPFHLAGSHGAEYRHPGTEEAADEGDAQARERRDAIVAEAEAAVADIPGAWVERKAFGLGLHTRTADAQDAARAQERVDELMAQQASDWRRRSGRDILEFAFRHEGKDAAIAALRDRVGATAVLFAGDDVTDEDALRALGADDLGVRVGEGETSAAVRVADPAALAALLGDLAERRRRTRS
ncbi:trehalose-phosphatase [Microbacterium sp. NPDC089189]|uniref:trehalose-phosphatase n=1 Tax=Microbacterium sp. NPDC089189 TaxID=3154972 RepID=UPI00343BFBBB